MSNFSDLKDIALSSSFQNSAAQLIGADMLNNFNLATMGAEILMEDDSTSQELLGINKSLGTPYETTIAKFNLGNTPGMVAASAMSAISGYSIYAPSDWLEYSRFLSDSTRRMRRPTDFDPVKAAAGMKLLDELLVDLKKYQSTDLLNAVTVPMSDITVTWTREARDRILLYLARMRTLKDADSKDESVSFEVAEFKKTSKKLHEELSKEKVMLKFFAKFEAFFYDEANRLLWQKHTPQNFLQAQRSLGIIRFSLAVNGLRKKNFDKAPDEPLAYLVFNTFNELNKEKVRKQRELNKEKKEESLRLAKGQQ